MERGAGGVRGTGDQPEVPREDQPAVFFQRHADQGAGSHTDVTLWFVLKGDSGAEVRPDLGEFSEVRWLSLDRTDWSEPCFDPHMDRFMRKLSSALETGSQR